MYEVRGVIKRGPFPGLHIGADTVCSARHETLSYGVEPWLWNRLVLRMFAGAGGVGNGGFGKLGGGQYPDEYPCTTYQFTTTTGNQCPGPQHGDGGAGHFPAAPQAP